MHSDPRAAVEPYPADLADGGFLHVARPNTRDWPFLCDMKSYV